MTVWIDASSRKKNLLKATNRESAFLMCHVRHVLEERLSFLRPTSHIQDILTLHGATNFQESLKDIYQTIKPPGVFLGAFFGDHTLFELKETFLKVEEEIFGQVTPRFLPLFTPSAVLEALKKEGFKDIVLDQEHIVFSYKTLEELYKDLKTMGETNCVSCRMKGLATPRFFDRCAALYHQRFSDDKGTLRATFEIFYVAAWRE